ncbi:MAG: cell envelope integrity protein CreD [Saprospiraceae bacterium]
MYAQKKSFFQSPATQISLKLLLIFVLVLFLLIPKFMILNLIDERKNLSLSVIDEVSAGWGSDQIITGPILVIPYYEDVLQEDKTKPKIREKKNLLVYPETLETDGTISTESKYRSLYKVLLYKSDMDVKGSFAIPTTDLLNINPTDILDHEAYIALGISDLKGIENKIDFHWNQASKSFSPGIGTLRFNFDVDPQNSDYSQKYIMNEGKGFSFNTGLQTKVSLDLNVNQYTFAFHLDIKGSKTLMFAPLGKTTKVHMKSSFPDPVFAGGFLPQHETNASGFDATWNILEYNKNLPAFQKDGYQVALSDNLFGVKIQHLVDTYTTTYRAGKYMILFITLTFLVVFLTEIVQKLKIHIFQYTLIGLALAIFFVLLLSISEFWGFDRAYFGASLATIGLIYLYSLGMFNSKKSSMLLLGLLSGLFAYIYLIIQLEKMALLAGALGLFVIIAATMYVTRKIKWFEEEANHSQSVP